jgi:hypothetical protein
MYVIGKYKFHQEHNMDSVLFHLAYHWKF